jgi:hypothetical protein
MKHKVKHVHFVGIGGVAMSREQGPVTYGVTGSARPRLAPAAAATVSSGAGSVR